jgi:hypothetical protein
VHTFMRLNTYCDFFVLLFIARLIIYDVYITSGSIPVIKDKSGLLYKINHLYARILEMS